MTRARALLVVLFLTIPWTASAQWRQNGAAVPDEPWRKSDGAFGAMLLLTDQPDSFIEQWGQPEAPGYVPRIQTVSEASHGDVVAAMILFIHCGADLTGRCRTVADYQVLRPDGSVYAGHEGAVVWQGEGTVGDALQLSETHLMFRIEPEDPEGVYEIHATVRDLVSTRTVHLVQKLTVSAAPARPAP